MKERIQEEFIHFCKFRCPYRNETVLPDNQDTIDVEIDLGQFGDHTVEVYLEEHIKDNYEVCNVCSAKQFYEQLMIEL